MTRNRAVQGERECFDFNLNRLSFRHEPNVFVFDLCLHFDGMVVRDDHEQLLSRRDDAADRMHRDLLDDAVDRRSQPLQTGFLTGLGDLLRKGSRFGFKCRKFCLFDLLKFRRHCPIVMLGFGKCRLILSAFLLLSS